MKNLDLAELHRKNTSFLCRHFFDERVRTPFETAIIYADEVEALIKSIEIFKCGQYSKPTFKNRILEIHAVPFWADLFLLEHYSTAKERTIKSIEKEQMQYDNNPDKDDFLTKHNFEQWLQDKQQKVIDIDNIINLTTEFRTLINEAFPKLENEFKSKLQAHNDLQKSEAEKTAKADEERRLKREEKQKRIETATEPKPFGGLLKTLDDTQLDKLFIFLTTKNKADSNHVFIDKDTIDRDSFNHIFGEKEITKPIKPIQWKATKQLLRELLTGLQEKQKPNKQNPDTIELSNEIERQTSTFFVDKSKKPLRLASNKTVLSKESDSLKSFLATI